MKRCIRSCFSLEASRFSQTGILPRGPLPQRAALPGPYHEPPDEEAGHRGEDEEHDDHSRDRCVGRRLVGGGWDSADEVAREGEALAAHAGRRHAALGHAPAVPAADLHGAVCAALDAPAAMIYSTHRLLPVLCCWAPRLRGGPKSHEGLARSGRLGWDGSRLSTCTSESEHPRLLRSGCANSEDAGPVYPSSPGTPQPARRGPAGR